MLDSFIRAFKAGQKARKCTYFVLSNTQSEILCLSVEKWPFIKLNKQLPQ